ncbi:hypothetical protein, partial [Rhizobium leguminosarum]|uniref:hypothetical protein n=1 Tax=Rhizobium leguminosarum TaxID=384 RepID=UPI001C97E473
HLRIVFPSKHRYPPSYACNYEGMARSLQQTNGFGGVMETPVTDQSRKLQISAVQTSVSEQPSRRLNQSRTPKILSSRR